MSCEGQNKGLSQSCMLPGYATLQRGGVCRHVAWEQSQLLGTNDLAHEATGQHAIVRNLQTLRALRNLLQNGVFNQARKVGVRTVV